MRSKSRIYILAVLLSFLLLVVVLQFDAIGGEHPGSPFSEPFTMILLGICLIGIAGFGIKKTNHPDSRGETRIPWVDHHSSALFRTGRKITAKDH